MKLDSIFGPTVSDNEEDFSAWLDYLSHEIRNPLGVVQNTLQFLYSLHPSALQRQAYDRIGRQIQHLERIISDLQEFNSRCLPTRLRTESFETIWEAAKEATRNGFEERQQKLTEKFPGTTTFLDADKTRLSQVFGNLLSNASKFTPVGGEVQMNASHESGFLVVKLRDSGRGISEDELPHVFELFYRGAGSLGENDESGDGIGLAVARHFVQQHGGTIAVSSAGAGKGSEFVVRLPIVN